MGSIGIGTTKSNNNLYSKNPDIESVTNDDIWDMMMHTGSLGEDDVTIPGGIGSSKHFLEAMNRYFQGEDKKSGIAASNSWFTKEEQNFIRNSSTTTNSPLYRIESSSWMGNLKEGQEFKFGGNTGDIRSFSTNSVASASLLQDAVHEGSYGRTPVIFQTSGKVNYFNAMPYTLKTNNYEYTSQYEAFVGGRWKVKKSDTITIDGYKVKRYIIERAK